jgi:alpha-L-arabinofuranosidase
MKRHNFFVLIFSALLLFRAAVNAQTGPSITLQLDQPGHAVSSKLYGLMTEEINYSYDGGLYAELIRNRVFKDNPMTPNHG